MRSLLTSLGIIIGVASVIIMIAVGQGSQASIEENIASLGTNLIIVFPAWSKAGGVSRGAGSFNGLTLEDADLLAKELTDITGVSPTIRTGDQVIGGTGNWNTSIQGVTNDFFKIRNWNLKQGDFFTETDIRSRRKMAILGKTVAENLFPGQNPVGEKIRIRNTPFTVIGVLAEKGQDPRGADQDDAIFAPATTVMYRLSGGYRRRVQMILVSANSMAVMDKVQENIRLLLNESHKINSGEEADFTVRTQAEITEAASATSRVLTILLGSIAGVSLVVGGIGIMNIMLVSVTERTREIGLRLSIGARKKDVLTQFLTEAVVLSFFGGIIGVGISVITSCTMNRFTEIHLVIKPMVVALALLFSGAVGVFFGYYPARKASKLNPIDALRYE
jgi:putative ABC transport system permease protein